MCRLFEEWSPEIRAYCLDNGLSFEKAQKMSKSWHNDDFLALGYDDHDPKKGNMGLLDDTPMPAVLFISKSKDGKLIFEQTEFTEKYLRDTDEFSHESKRQIV